jgi:hypothetical protein
MIAFQVSRRRRSTYQRNKADPSRLRRFGVASLGRRHGKLHQDAISAPADGGLLHAPLGIRRKTKWIISFYFVLFF